jgi:translation initiation factor 2 subunit 2
MAECFAVEKEDIPCEQRISTSELSSREDMVQVVPRESKKKVYEDIDLGEFDLDIDYSKKKKKKAKKELEKVENEILETETTIAHTDAMATIMNAHAISAEAKAIAAQANAISMVADAVASKLDEVVIALGEDLEILNLKKKKKKKALKALVDEDTEVKEVTGSVAEDVDDDEPTYDQMLNRLYDQLYAGRPEMRADVASKRIKPPSLAKIGTKKTCWTNFSDYQVTFNRPIDHMQSFVLSELGVTGSLNEESQLIMKTRIMTKNVESLLRKYIDEYVRCVTCKGIETNLVKDSASKLHFIQCKKCLASRSVAAIKAGYQATTKADRKAARE